MTRTGSKESRSRSRAAINIGPLTCSDLFIHPISNITLEHSLLRQITPPFERLTTSTKMDSDPGFIAAVEEARASFEEGGVPIGACLVSKDGKILGRGHNMRVQNGSATLHVGRSWTRV